MLYIDSANPTRTDRFPTYDPRFECQFNQKNKQTAEATGDLIGSKIADEITSLGKTKIKEKEDERQEIYIPPEKRQQIINDLRLF